MSADAVECVGTVVEALRGDLYRIDVDLGWGKRRVLARRAGKLVSAHIRVLAGDTVTLELSPYDMSRGRITYRGERAPR